MYTTTKYAGAASADATWTTVTNAQGVQDGAVAYQANIGPGGGSQPCTPITLSQFGFALPSSIIIYGIKLEAYVYMSGGNAGSENTNHLIYPTGTTLEANTPGYGQSWGTSGSWKVWGDSSSLWGRTWTPSEINDASFGVAMSDFPGTGTAQQNVDSVRITVYWDYAPLPNGTIQKQYVYQIFRQGQYLGLLPNVTSDFNPSQDINTAGTSITIECAVSADVSGLDIPLLETEDGQPLQTEAGDNLTLEAYPDVVGNNNSNALFRNGNQVIVWEYSNYHQNGIQVFSGDIEKWEAAFGTSNGDIIKVTCYSDGAELNNFLILGGDTLDQSQTSQNTAVSIYNGFGGKGGGWNKEGQTFTMGAGITNLEGISILTTGGATFILNVYNSVGDANSGVSPLASVSVSVPSYGTPTEVKFVFSPILAVASGASLFFTVDTNADASAPVNVYKQNTDVYSGGSAYNSNYGGGSGGGSWYTDTGDLWFKTWYGGTSTTNAYTATDPASMVTDMITRYNSKGGVIKTATGSVDLTGLSLNYTFKVSTLLEGIQKAEELAPYNWYWYVDIGSNTLYFKKTATTAKYQLIKGKHITGLNLAASTENVKNLLYFTGGLVSGTNLFSSYSDAGSVQNNKQRLARQTDNRVTVQGTADAIGNSFVGANKNESYQTSVTVLDTTMDISLFKLGDTIGFGGFGNFIDQLVLQIVRIQKTPEQVTMTLGELPPQVNQTIKDIQKSLTDLETLQNP